MRVVAHDPFISTEIAGSLGVRLLSLDEVCAAADYLTLHVPSTPETHHLLDAERFKRCKVGIRIVNTARGDLIDEQALQHAIESGIVAGAASRCFRERTSDRLVTCQTAAGDQHAAYRRRRPRRRRRW